MGHPFDVRISECSYYLASASADGSAKVSNSRIPCSFWEHFVQSHTHTHTHTRNTHTHTHTHTQHTYTHTHTHTTHTHTHATHSHTHTHAHTLRLVLFSKCIL